MSILPKIRTLRSLDNEKKLLLLEAFIYLAWGRLLKIIPFSKLAPSLGFHMLETDLIENPNHRDIVRSVSSAIHIMSQYTFWESECLVKAIAGMKMLQKRSIESTLYLGTGKDAEGKLIAHAWLRSGTFFISGSEGMDKFTVVGTFANQTGGKREKI